MKNIENCTIETSISMEPDDYETLMEHFYGKYVQVEFSLETGIYVGMPSVSSVHNDNPDTPNMNDINEKLAEYFGVKKVTNVYYGGCEDFKIHIVYQE